MAKEEVLTSMQLNRATLARQMLLAREGVDPLQAVARLAGLQAQLPRPPFVGLFSRVVGFRAEDLTRLLHARRLVRGTMMRGTLHLVTTDDFLKWRPALQPMLSAAMKAVLRDRAEGLPLEGLLAAARVSLDERPQTFEELRAVLGRQWPRSDVRALGYAVRTHLPLVQVPTETRWGWPASADFAVAESWLGRPVGGKDGAQDLVLRYLSAFGPATVKDAEAWSGLRDLQGVVDPLRKTLRAFRDERGRELFDLPKAPRPSGDTKVPVRFLPDYDNLLLAHADRSRIIADEHRARVATANLRILPTFLVDGRVTGTWKVERVRKVATLMLEPFDAVPRAERAALTEEGTALLAFLEEDATTRRVQFS